MMTWQSWGGGKSLNLLQSSRNKTFGIFLFASLHSATKTVTRRVRAEKTALPGEIIKKFVQIIKHKLCIFMEIKARRQRDI